MNVSVLVLVLPGKTLMCALLTVRSAPQMREEQREVVARHGPALTRAAVADMRWADAMAREVLRLRGPAEGLYRCARNPHAVGLSVIKAALASPVVVPAFQSACAGQDLRTAGVPAQGLCWCTCSS